MSEMNSERPNWKRRENTGLFKKNGYWWMDIRYRGKRYRQKLSPDKRQADLILKKVKVDIAENRFLDIRKQQKILFENMADEYITAYSRIHKKSWQTDEMLLRQLKRFFSGKYLHEITPKMIEDYKRKRLDAKKRGGISEDSKVSKTTIDREVGTLGHVFTKAIEWGKIKENPVRKVKMFRVNNQRMRFLETGEIKMLLDTLSDPPKRKDEFDIKPIVITALNSGLRRGEIVNLIWDDIDFDRGLITVKETKNKETRYIPMNSGLIDLFNKLKENCNLDSPYVFCNRDGDKVLGCKVADKFRAKVRELNIKDFKFHDLRHTFASHLVMSGVDIMTVKELLGHKTLNMTLRYSHLSPGFKKSAVELLCNRMDTLWTRENTKKEKMHNIASINAKKQENEKGFVYYNRRTGWFWQIDTFKITC